MSKKSTKEKFLLKVNKIHGNKYNYNKFIYSGWNIKGIIICNTCHNEFPQTPNNHLHGRGCPKCAIFHRVDKTNMTRLKKRDSLKDKRIDLIKEWNYNKNYPLRPENYTEYSNKKVWWICKNKHEWEAQISKRTEGKNCPYCSGRYATKENNLLIKNPELCKEWDYEKNGDLKPEQFLSHSNKKVWWKCKLNHSWRATINNRSNNRGCSICNSWYNQERCREIFKQLFRVEFNKKQFFIKKYV